MDKGRVYTTIVIDNHGRIYDLGALERVPKSGDTWGGNAFTCLVSEVNKIKPSEKRGKHGC